MEAAPKLRTESGLSLKNFRETFGREFALAEEHREDPDPIGPSSQKEYD